MNHADFKQTNPGTGQPCGTVKALPWVMVLLLASIPGFGAEPLPTKYQVEAAYMLNFAKYVEWPAAAFANAAAPITIGVLGTDPFGESLRHAVEGRTINGRSFVITNLVSGSEFNGCHILYISGSEGSQLGGILEKAGALPVLTVGEDERFARNGGVINFALKNGSVRLEIDLAAARKSGLTISSKLLTVADVVREKSN